MLSVCISDKSNCFPYFVSTLTSQILVFNRVKINQNLSQSSTFKIENSLGIGIYNNFYLGTYCRDGTYL